MKRLLFWIVYNVPLGKLAPYVLGLAFGSFPKKVKPDDFCSYDKRKED